MNISEDKLEQRLRALFADERLDLPPPADAGSAIVAGAQRLRRRRHSMAVTSGVVAAAVIVSGGLAVFKIQSQDNAAVMSAGPPELSVKPPDNLTPGIPPQVSSPTTPSTQQTQAPASGTDTRTQKTTTHASTTTPQAPPVTTGPLLAADGFGQLKLGMTEADAAAQGITFTNKQPFGACELFDAQGNGVPGAASVAISAAHGLVMVNPAEAAHTPEGIGAGSSKSQVLAAYPGASNEPGMLIAPARSISEYHFALDGKGIVTATLLYSTNQDCAG